jgi:xanthine dehydrogenase accessory factor
MREVIKAIEAWKQEGRAIAIATNVKKEGSSLRPLGAKMAVTNGQKIAGSVTGGCIEGAVYEEAMGVLQSGEPKLLHYGVPAEETPWEVGLSCGGTLDVFIEALDSKGWQEVYPVLRKCLETNQRVAAVTVIAGRGLGSKMLVWPDGRTFGSLGSTDLDKEAARWAQKQVLTKDSDWTHLAESDVFVDVLSPPSRLIVIGAVHIAIPLVALAKTLDFHTIVIDPRKAFATRERFPIVDELVHDWPTTALEKLRPDEGTCIAVISHDEKLDNPALQVALASPACYVGVLGTRKKLSKRLAVLREMGVSEEQLRRLRAPIGLNIGAVLPGEIALAILAEMVSVQHGIIQPQETRATLPISFVS